MLRARLLVGLLLAACLLCTAAPAPAAKVKVWQHQQQKDFDKAQFKQAIVTSQGALRLSRQVKPLGDLQAAHVWSVIEDAKGNLFAATGDEGKLFKVAPDGKSTLAYTSTDSQILSLTEGPEGVVFAGTGPSGRIIHVPPMGNPRVLASDLDSYVWDLVFDPSTQMLYAATGPKGRIYQITPEGKSFVYYQTKQEHVLCLAAGPKGTLYAGTDKGGLVYRIDGKGKGYVLYHAHQSEVRSLLVTPDAIYAGTSSPTRRPGSGGTTKTTTSLLEKQPAIQVAAADSDLDLFAQGPAPAPSAPPVGENSVYRIANDGSVRELFRDKLLMLCLARHNGKLLVGTGMQGQLFEIDEADKERSEIARLDHGQIHCLLKRRDGSLVLGTGDPGKLYVLEDRFAAKGTVLSEVLDAKLMSKWGALTWKAAAPPGSNVSVAVRAGNVAEPDDTWSDWSAEEADPREAKASAPTARYLQYRVTLTSEKPNVSPEFKHFVLRYKTTNQPPEVTSLDVPDTDAANQDTPRKLKVKWSAIDPNEDELTYRLYIRKEGWKDWVQLEEDLEKKDYEWDPTTVPSGTYQMKVVASDRKDNAPEETLTAERISAPFPVAHAAPTVTLKVTGVDGDQATIEGSAADPLVRLTEASFAVNGKRWANVFPVDGIFDSKSESFRFKTETLRPGNYVLMLRVKDAAGNVGSADVMFTVPARK